MLFYLSSYLTLIYESLFLILAKKLLFQGFNLIQFTGINSYMLQ